MRLAPRLALRLEPCEVAALKFNQCYTNAVRRVEENRRAELAGPAEHGGDEHCPATPKTVAHTGRSKGPGGGRVR